MQAKSVAALSALLVLGACTDQLQVPDYNNQSLEGLTANPTASAIAVAAQGLLVGSRADAAEMNLDIGILGRELYNLAPEEPRYVSELEVGVLDPAVFGGSFWPAEYTDIKTAYTLLHAVDVASSLTDQQKEAVRGFTQTIQALDLLTVIDTHDDAGAAIDVDRAISDPLAPIADKKTVFDRIKQLLDQARTHLQSGGSNFPFQLTPGYAGFDSPATFIQFNRALRARVDVYTGDYASALTDLQASFLSTGVPLSLGVYHSYSTGSGDATNRDYDPSARTIRGEPTLATDVRFQANGKADLRFTTKVDSVGAYTFGGLTSNLRMNVYNSPSAPVPIVRNEDLILLRAEAELMTGDAASAGVDINFIRVNSGGLTPINGAAWVAMTPDQQTTELLYNRRYSLLFEGHRWIDTRRFARLNQLPKELPTGRIFYRFPIPQAECQPRSPTPAGCTPDPGIPGA